MSYPVPDGCPSATDLGTAYQDDPEFFRAVSLDLLSTQVAAPLPSGGCAYVADGVHATNSGGGLPPKIIMVFYFRFGEGATTTVTLRKWGATAGVSAGALSEDGGFDLPQSFSGWDTADVEWGTDLFPLGATTIPEYTQGAAARVYFALDATTIETLESASAPAETGKDPASLLAAGLSAPFSMSMSATNADGYTVDISVNGSLKPFTKNITTAVPGRFRLVSNAVINSSSIANTTQGRRSPAPGLTVWAVYPIGSSICADIYPNQLTRDGEKDATYCRIGIAAGGASSGYLDPGATSSDAVTADPDPIQYASVTFDEAGDALSQANSPASMYLRLGGGDWSAAVGCRAGDDWVVPMSGWPDPLCAP